MLVQKIVAASAARIVYLPMAILALIVGLVMFSAGEASAESPGIKPSVFSEVRLIQMDRMPQANATHQGAGMEQGESHDHPAAGSHSDDRLSFSGQLNLILDTKNLEISDDKIARGHFNLEFSDSLNFGGHGHGSGHLTVKDAFVEILISDAFNLRAGQMLTDFGIYNRIHDYGVTFVRDVPPLMYNEEILGLTTGDDHFIPEFSSFSILGRVDLFSGFEYTLFVGNGLIGEDGMDVNREKLFGGRALLKVDDRLAVGASSAYSDDSVGDLTERSFWIGADLQVVCGRAGLNAELVQKTEDEGVSSTRAVSWYAEAWYEQEVGALILAPFAGYDIIDPDTDQGNDTSDRVSAGVNFIFSPELRLKLAHHWHSYTRPADGAKHDFQMITVGLDFLAY